jgi:hypothetical protein
VIVREIECKSILTKSSIEGVDYALNPYVGCVHGCVYCYASFMKRFTGHKEEWGAFVDVKVNAAKVLARQMRGKVRKVLERDYPDLVEEYRHIAADRRSYHEALMARVQRLAEKHGLA